MVEAAHLLECGQGLGPKSMIHIAPGGRAKPKACAFSSPLDERRTMWVRCEYVHFRDTWFAKERLAGL